MKVRLLNFHYLISSNDALLGCGMFTITYERAVLYEGQQTGNMIYLALINPEV